MIFLLDNGASVHVTNLFGDTPLMASAVMALLSFFSLSFWAFLKKILARSWSHKSIWRYGVAVV